MANQLREIFRDLVLTLSYSGPQSSIRLIAQSGDLWTYAESFAAHMLLGTLEGAEISAAELAHAALYLSTDSYSCSSIHSGRSCSIIRR